MGGKIRASTTPNRSCFDWAQHERFGGKSHFGKLFLAESLGFIDDLEKAYTHISCHPTTGSSRYAHELNLPGLRFWPLTRYPYLVFYVEHENHIDVWRVLHAHRDIPAWMSSDDNGGITN